MQMQSKDARLDRPVQALEDSTDLHEVLRAIDLRTTSGELRRALTEARRVAGLLAKALLAAVRENAPAVAPPIPRGRQPRSPKADEVPP